MVNIGEKLKGRGLRVWVDEDQMHGHLQETMTTAIDNSRVILVFITQEYVDKVRWGECDLKV